MRFTEPYKGLIMLHGDIGLVILGIYIDYIDTIYKLNIG
jgi:hypothetical protein